MSEDLLAVAAGWRAQGERVAIATVVETWGSSPRPAGSRFIVSDAGHMAGSVSGGCIEGAVQLLVFGMSDEAAWVVGLACGGKLKVFLEQLG